MLAEQLEAAKPEPCRSPVAAALSGDFFIVLLLFVFFRFMAIVLFLPGGYLFRGQLDHGFYSSFAELSVRGYYPYLHYWLEYPPLFAWTLVGAYQLAILLPPVGDGFFWFHSIVSMFLLLAESGNLGLVYLIAREMHDRRTALRCAWMYALLFMPLYVLLGTFDSYPLFFLLLGLYLVLRRRPWLGGLATGIGFQVKLLPLLVMPVAWRALTSHRHRLAYLLAITAATGLIALPFWLANRTLLVASFRAMLGRSSWETIWALLDGYYSFGKVAPIADRFFPETAEWQSHASSLPWLWIEAGFVVLYALFWTRRLDWRSTGSLVALAGLTVNLAFLASKGYSPQFLVYLLPFIVLLLPNVQGVIYIVLLSVADFVEGVLYLTFFLKTHWLLVVTVLGRTVLWLLLCFEYLVVLLPKWRRWRDALRGTALLPGVALAVAVPLASLGVLPVLLSPTAAEEYGPAADFIRAQDPEDQAIVLPNSDTFVRARRYLPSAAFWFPTVRAGTSADRVDADLADFVRDRSRVWLLADHERGEALQIAAARSWLDWYGSPAAARWFEGLELRYYRLPSSGDPSLRVGHPLHAAFGPLELLGYDALSPDLVAGEPFRLILYWRASAVTATDYHTFVHLVNPVYRSFGTGDKALVDEQGWPPTRWAAGQVVRQTYDLNALPGTPPGEYWLEVGLYDPHSGARLPVLERADGQGPPDRVLIPRVTVRRGQAGLLPAPQRRLAVSAGGEAYLLGYDLTGQTTAGGTLGVTLYWRALRQIRDDYTVFVHLVDGQGRIRAQHDAAPADSFYPTSRWLRAELVRDSHDLPLPRDLLPGSYRLHIGLYLPDSGRRLRVSNEGGRDAGDYVDLGEVFVSAQ